MTYKEAKNLIDDITWKYDGSSITYEMMHACRDKCREALEKQIPKKTVVVKSSIVCPTCKTLVGSSPYCRYCGQAIDWEGIK